MCVWFFYFILFYVLELSLCLLFVMINDLGFFWGFFAEKAKKKNEERKCHFYHLRSQKVSKMGTGRGKK